MLLFFLKNIQYYSPMDFGPGCPWYEMLQQYGEANVKWCE
jgi:hypothetical protein